MTLRHLLIAALALPAAPLLAAAVPASIAAAISDPGRPARDKARDATRKPAEMLAFAEVKPGQTAVDFFPGGGYFTRLFSTAVGPKGMVYAATPQTILDRLQASGEAPPSPVSSEAGHANVHETVFSDTSLGTASKADLVWTSQNYHDIHIWDGAEGTARLNKAVFNALKPGGLYVVLDHAGAPGLDDAGIGQLHRIDEALVKKEVTAAGFVLDGESQLLHNPADPHSANSSDASIRGKTDQFLLRFRKPR